MKPKILLWISHDLTEYCTAYYLQKSIDADFYAVIDVTDDLKQFFKEQTLVKFSKIWFYHDLINSSINVQPNFLETFEDKYNIDIWQLAKNDRIFRHDFYEYHQFSKKEIQEILEKECTFFEEILDDVQPDFFITLETALRPHHFFYLLSKKKEVKVLMLNAANWGNYCYISENYHRLTNFSEIFSTTDCPTTTFEEVENLLKTNTRFKKHGGLPSSHRSSKLEKISAAFHYLFISKNTNSKTHYTYFGRNKLKVLFKEIIAILKIKYRKRYIDQNLLYKIPDHPQIVFLPLQQQPERSLLISAPNHTNQIETVNFISESLPENYILVVKEHPTQGPPNRDWRKISDYKKMQKNSNVRLIHPSVAADTIIKKSKLVISVSGTITLESAFFNTPSITFAENDYPLLSSITHLKSQNKLSDTIKNCLEKKVNPTEVKKYFNILENNSFIFDLLSFQDNYLKHFFFDGNLLDVKFSESQMEEFLIKHKSTLELLANEFKKCLIRSS